MGSRHLAVLAFAISLAWGCGDDDDPDAGGDAASSQDASAEDGSTEDAPTTMDGCIPRDCASLLPACGDVDDGCGTTLTCRCPPGAGHREHTCPAGATRIGPSDDVDAIINAGARGDVFCIEGRHIVDNRIQLLSDQHLIGIGTDARISGARQITSWEPHPTEPGVFMHDLRASDPDLAAQLPSRMPPQLTVHYSIAELADDVFFDDRRMMRVLSVPQLTGDEPLPPGQAETDGEFGRFFVDDGAGVIYIDQDPAGHTVELAVVGFHDRLPLHEREVMLWGAGQDGVTIQNLTLEKTVGTILYAASGDSWLIEDCTIRFAHFFGIRGTGGKRSADDIPFTVRRTLLTNNGRLGMGGNQRGTDGILIEDSELSWNNIANYRRTTGYAIGGSTMIHGVAGTVDEPALVVRGLESHHNIGDGFWTDIGNQGVLVEDSHFHHNERNGYFHEISCEIVFRNNHVHDNGLTLKNPDISGSGYVFGVLALNSNDGQFHDNFVHDNPNGIGVVLWPHTNMCNVPCQGHSPCAFGSTPDRDISNSAFRNRVYDNRIYMCDGISGGFGELAVLTARDNTFSSNQYYVPDAMGDFWRNRAHLDWDEWQAQGHDTDGSRTVGCEPAATTRP